MIARFRRMATVETGVACATCVLAPLTAAVAFAGFKPADRYPVGERPVDVVTGDLNRDGKSDLVVSNSVSTTFSLLRGKGNGRFRPAMDYRAGDPRIGTANWIAIGGSGAQ
jgi:hypothetical protein